MMEHKGNGWTCETRRIQPFSGSQETVCPGFTSTPVPKDQILVTNEEMELDKKTPARVYR
jgi:hypothetical protein